VVNPHDAATKTLTEELTPIDLPPLVSRHVSTASDAAELFMAITAKKWRRSSLSAASSADVKRKIEEAVLDDRPIVFTLPFGGYKAWHEGRLPNWAEVFALAHLRRYLAEIAKLWPAGVVAEFTYLSNTLDYVSNMPIAWQEEYLVAFEQATTRYSCDRIRMSVVDISSLPTTPPNIRSLVIEKAKSLKDTWEAQAKPEEQDHILASASRNLVPNGVRDLRELLPAEWEKEVRLAAIACFALDSQPVRRDYNKFSHRIQLVYVRGPEPAIHIGSCATSSNHFAATSGVLERRADERYLPRILSSSSIDRASPVTIDTAAVGEPLGWASLNTCRIVTMP